MRQEIWKYELAVTDRQVVEMPLGAQILTVQVQRDVPCLWAIVSTDAKRMPRTIDTFGTGHAISGSPGRYIGTYQLNRGALVFHVFEVGPLDEGRRTRAAGEA